MSFGAVTVFVVAYTLIASDRFNKTLVALAGAAVVVTLPVIRSENVFYSHQNGIDWDVIFLLLGMMIIVSVLRQTSVFEYVAIWAAKRAKGSPLRIMILLVLVMAVGSALLDNVTTVLLIAPVTLLVCDRFIMVGALVKTGVTNELARAATAVTGGDALQTVMLILGVSAPMSGIIDNIPYVATMTPIVTELAAATSGQVRSDTLWWALALGADFGGNLTAVGASANVVMLGIARRAGNPIGFWEFTRKGVLVTVVSLTLSAIYLWVRYFVFG